MAEFKTTDIILAACLRLFDYNMTEIELSGSKGTFVFQDSAEEVATFVHDYDLGKCLVEPVAFNNMIKQLTTSVRRMTQHG